MRGVAFRHFGFVSRSGGEGRQVLDLGITECAVVQAGIAQKTSEVVAGRSAGSFRADAEWSIARGQIAVDLVLRDFFPVNIKPDPEAVIRAGDVVPLAVSAGTKAAPRGEPSPVTRSYLAAAV